MLQKILNTSAFSGLQTIPAREKKSAGSGASVGLLLAESIETTGELVGAEDSEVGSRLCVGTSVGSSELVGFSDGSSEKLGSELGSAVGSALGSAVGSAVGSALGSAVGSLLGEVLGWAVG